VSAESPVTVGGFTAYGSHSQPDWRGLYQVAIQVPASLADGDYPVIASVSGQQSPIASDPQASESKDALRTRNAWARLSLAGRT
jgi:hypothetical protein